MKYPFRSAAIVLHNNKILLIYRKKADKIYYTFPGGTIESNETPEKAAIRELFEETSIIAKLNRILYSLSITGKNFKQEYFFLCNYISGKPNLNPNAIENQRINNNNIYKPLWIPIDKIENILLYPLEIRDLLIKDIKFGFNFNVKNIKINQSELRHN